ncbi:MAG: hypothetical protein QOE31_3438 [Solirubrobacteraceae bacterium]|nr:hypothetical protein [Solirubrobacteraceae bacterium]
MRRELRQHLRTTRRIAAAVPLAALACAAAPAVAGAAAVTIGPANVFSAPGVAVDAAGTAYIAWRGPEPGLGSLQFCRLPRGASACNVRHAIAAPGDSVTRAFVVVSGTRVVVVQYRYGVENGMFAFTSTDGGVTFGAGVQVGTIPFSDAVPGPGDTLSGVTNAASIGGAFQNVPLAGGAATTYAALWGGELPYNGAVGLVDAATPLAIFATGSDVAQFRRFSAGSPNDAAGWTPPADLGVASYPKLAGGPTGLALLASNGGFPPTLYARKFNGTTFGAPVTVTSGASPSSLHAFQDAGGRVHAVVVVNAADGLHLVHAISDDIASWRSGTVLVQSVAAVGGIASPRIATAPDHIGVIAWNAGDKEIRVAAVGPDIPPVAPKKIAVSASATRGATKVIVKIAGSISLPAGVAKAGACSGTVKVSIKRGTTPIASKTAKVRSTCAFSLTTAIARSKVKRATRLPVTYRFSGNSRLKALKRVVSLKVR